MLYQFISTCTFCATHAIATILSIIYLIVLCQCPYFALASNVGWHTNWLWTINCTKFGNFVNREDWNYASDIRFTLQSGFWTGWFSTRSTIQSCCNTVYHDTEYDLGRTSTFNTLSNRLQGNQQAIGKYFIQGNPFESMGPFSLDNTGFRYTALFVQS